MQLTEQEAQERLEKAPLTISIRVWKGNQKVQENFLDDRKRQPTAIIHISKED